MNPTHFGVTLTSSNITMKLTFKLESLWQSPELLIKTHHQVKISLCPIFCFMTKCLQNEWHSHQLSCASSFVLINKCWHTSMLHWMMNMLKITPSNQHVNIEVQTKTTKNLWRKWSRSSQKLSLETFTCGWNINLISPEQSINLTQLQGSIFELRGSCSQVHLAYWDEKQLLAASQRMNGGLTWASNKYVAFLIFGQIRPSSRPTF